MKSRENRATSIGNRSRRVSCLCFYISRPLIVPVLRFIHSTEFSLMQWLFISDVATLGGSTNGFAFASRSIRLFCVFLVSISPHKVAWVLEDGPGTSASANTRLSPLERFICTRGEIIFVTRNTPAAAYCCWETSCLNTDTFRLYVYLMCIISASLGKRFGKCGT